MSEAPIIQGRRLGPAELEETLHDLVQPLMEKWIPSPEERFTWPGGTDPKQITGYVEQAKDHYRGRFQINETDGARVEMENGWALFRGSQRPRPPDAFP